MPVYTFRRTSTDETWVESMKISEMQEKLAADPDLDVIPGCTAYCDSWRVGITKPSNGFRDVLKHIKSRNPKSTIPTY